MRKPDFATLRVQIVGTKGHAGAMLRVVLAAAGVGYVVQIEDRAKPCRFSRRSISTPCSWRKPISTA